MHKPVPGGFRWYFPLTHFALVPFFGYKFCFNRQKNSPYERLRRGSVPVPTFVLSLVFCLAQNIGAWAQEPAPPRTLTPEGYFQLIDANHPVARQAGLLPAQGRAMLLRARGGFDPKLSGNWEQKRYEGKDYFGLLEAGLKIPLWIGEAKIGYDWAQGDYLSPEHTVPAQGQSVVGITMPLLQGLMIDQRRADLQQANIFIAANENERRAILNELYYKAALTYWDWAGANLAVSLFENSVRIADERLEGVRQSVLLGDRPVIDTTEALLILQDRQYLLNEAKLGRQTATLALSVFLWTQDGKPLEADTALLPVPLNAQSFDLLPFDSLDLMLAQLRSTHPDLVEYVFKLQSLDVERRLKAEKLKPKLDAEYNALAGAFNYWGGNEPYAPAIANNYKWGVRFSMPLFLRAERADLELTRLKQQEAQLEQTQKQRELEAKLRAAFYKMATYASQIELYRATTENYRQLFEVERYRFSLGESSLFLVNSREGKLLEAQTKLLELYVAYFQARATIGWAAGLGF